MMPSGDRKDPFRGYNFKLEFEGLSQARFMEASGLEAHLEGTGKEAQTADHPQKIPGSHKVGDVTLKRGILQDTNLWNWYDSVAQGQPRRKNGSIVLIDENGEEKVRWSFVNGWVTKWTGPTFNADANDVAIETLQIAHEGLTRKWK
jgi:phage tail-like protein